MREYINPEIVANIGMSIIGISLVVLFIRIYLTERKFEKLSRERNTRV